VASNNFANFPLAGTISGMRLNIRDVRLGERSQRGWAWLVLGLLAQVAACSSTSSSDGGRDAPKSTDVLPAHADAPLVKEGGTADRIVPDAAGIDVPLTSDTGSPSLDSPAAKGDGTQDAPVMGDASGGSSDLVQERIQPDSKAPQDTAAGRDSSLSEDARQADALRAADAPDARSDTLSIVPLSDPGTPVYTTSRAGSGACAGKTVASLIEEIQDAYPKARGGGLYTPSTFTDGSFTYAFAPRDGGFAFVFQYGEGDCPAGCISHTYWYFQTDANCVPWQVGMYDPSRSCGTAMWGVPTSYSTMPRKTCP